MDRNEFKKSKRKRMTMAKQVQSSKQKKVDEEFISLAESSIKKDEKLLRKLAKA